MMSFKHGTTLGGVADTAGLYNTPNNNPVNLTQLNLLLMSHEELQGVDVACEICSVASSTSLPCDLHPGSATHCPSGHPYVVAVEPAHYLSRALIYTKPNVAPIPFINWTRVLKDASILFAYEDNR